MSSNTWATGTTYANRFRNDFAYDANGNIMNQLRDSLNGAEADSLQYFYDSTVTCQNSALYRKLNNRLLKVHNRTDGHNMLFQYDALGNLVKDSESEIDTILWTLSGKIKAIDRTTASTLDKLTFDYDATGNRIAKHVFDSNGTLKHSTYYVRDAQGNIMSTYDYLPAGSYLLTERDLYGSSRLGMLSDTMEMLGAPSVCTLTSQSHWLGKKKYELTNHLGNVLATVSDRKLPLPAGSLISYFQPDILSATDYYPFGMEMAGRSFSLNYRFGFNGNEMDNEIKGAGYSYNFGARIYDPRICKFLSMDPKYKEFADWSPYVYALDNPIKFLDIEGMGAGDGTLKVLILAIQVPTANGVKLIYFAKRYYENVTPAQVNKYKREALTPNGWYVVSKEEYEAQQKRPSAFSSKVNGADTPEKYRELAMVIGSPFVFQNLHSVGNLTGTVRVSTSGKDANGNLVSEVFTFNVVDKDGKVISTETKTVEGGGTVEFDYNLKDDQVFRVSRSDNTVDASIGVFTKAKKGDKAQSNMEDFDKEKPKAEDISKIISLIF